VAGNDGGPESLLAAITEHSTDGIISTTLDGVITSWNAGAANIYGYTAGEMIGRKVPDLIPGEQAGELTAALDRVRGGERVAHFETARTRKDGAAIEVSASVAPIRDASGAVTGVLTLVQDVTERNRADAEHRTRGERMHQAERLETVGQLAGGIAHDFNNLLAAIVGFAGLIIEEVADPPAVRADARQILTTAQRAGRLTRELLIFSRREPAKPETVSLNDVIADVRSLLAASIGEQTGLRFSLAPTLPAVRADRGRLEQVLLNLAINARDAMQEGGTLTISTGHAHLGEEAGSSLSPQIAAGQYVELAVTDTGTGMSADVADRVFEPFFTTKQLTQGTGLGLSTVYGIVTQADGAIGVDTEVGAGTTFHVYFPAIGEPVPSTPATTAMGRGSGELILVVDDDPSVLEVTSRILRRNGYGTIEAGTSEEALRLVSVHDFQLLLTDSVMPGISGPALAARALRIRPGLRVLHMSGYTPPDMADETRGEAFLQKPFTAEVLLAKVRAALGEPATS
jgi:PAS domain S-box-containing protein